jgi:hypothetical protein
MIRFFFFVLLMTTAHCASCRAASTPTLWESYQENPNAHPNIPDNSFAGYAYGEKPLPELPVVVNATDFGAVAGGQTDCTQAISNAIEAAAKKGGGAVLLPAGTWRISGVLWMRASGVVLRGEGIGKTVLFCTQPLQDALGKNLWGAKSAWSWSGGFVWFAPREVRPADWKPPTRHEGWINNAPLSNIIAEVKRGDTVITVEDASKLRAGGRVLLSLRDSGDFSLWKNMSGDVAGAHEYDWPVKAKLIISDPEWKWPVEILSVDGNRVTLRQPLRTDIFKKWQPRFLSLGPVIENSGVEHLTIQMEKANLSRHLENPGWNGIYFENAWDCWAREVAVLDCDNGIGTASSKCISIENFSVAGRNCHHATFCRVSTHDTLWTRFRVECKTHHGINVEGLSSGNVWSAGDMAHGTFDSHRGLPFENIRTDITIFNDGNHGGANDAGPLFGARFCHWNIRVLNARADMINVPQMMPRGALVGIQGAAQAAKQSPDFGDESGAVIEEFQISAPPDLHRAQLALRLGRPLPTAVHGNGGN